MYVVRPALEDIFVSLSLKNNIVYVNWNKKWETRNVEESEPYVGQGFKKY